MIICLPRNKTGKTKHASLDWGLTIDPSYVVGAAPVCAFHHSDTDGNDKPVSSSLSHFSQDCDSKIFNKSKAKKIHIM